ncbi:uncharacterized protein [Montipora capricornis]|uniref:uncharacterized protein isoform X2 n=1 Tax=Montipora capricornis TaxID=246305 RepID=UPI0035F116BF
MKAAPSKNAFAKLRDMGRAKEIAFTKKHTSAEIHRPLRADFPTLCDVDLSCLSIISSYDRGHAMSIVYKGVPNGEKIMELFGEMSKRRFIYTGAEKQIRPVHLSPTQLWFHLLHPERLPCPHLLHCHPQLTTFLQHYSDHFHNHHQAHSLLQNRCWEGWPTCYPFDIGYTSKSETRRYLSALAPGNSDGV